MNRQEYNASVNDWSDSLYRFALRILRDQAQAEDAVQECYLALWERHEGVAAEKVKSYLFTSMYHHALNILRRQRPTTDLEHCAAAYEHGNFDVQEQIDRGLAQLPPIQRTALTLRDYEGYSYAEIGAMAKLSESQVKVYIHRGRLALRKFIGSPDELI